MIDVMKPHKQSIALFSVILVSVITYLPAVDNFFIADDFGLFTVIEAAENSPQWFFSSTTEFFRLMSYIYFAACRELFGLNPEPYYWAGIGLHAIAAVLVYFLVLQVSRSSMAAWAAALFFAAYERHQEAVMWISAANETVLALNCLVFLLLWQRAADSGSRVVLILAHAVFVQFEIVHGKIGDRLSRSVLNGDVDRNDWNVYLKRIKGFLGGNPCCAYKRGQQ